MGHYDRPHEGIPFGAGGMDLRDRPDAVPLGKYVYLQNVRSIGDKSLQTRSGQSAPIFITDGAAPVTDLRAYTALETDNLPRFLARDGHDRIWLDNGVQVGTLASGPGPLYAPGAVLLPFRPAASPQPWMYVANGYDYQKFSSPSPTNVVVAAKVGIAEPQLPLDAAPMPWQFVQVQPPAGNFWITGGTASGLSVGDRSTDSISAAIADPALSTRLSLQVSAAVEYQRGEVVTIATAAGPSAVWGLLSLYESTTAPSVQTFVIEDVIPSLTLSINIESIYYYTGSSGRCVITSLGLTAASGAKEPSIFTEAVIARFRRGALIQIGSEVCYVLSATTGPNGQVCFETSTTATHAAGELIVGLPTIVVNGVANAPSIAPGTALTGDFANVQNFAVASGIGTLTMGAGGGGAGGASSSSATDPSSTALQNPVSGSDWEFLVFDVPTWRTVGPNPSVGDLPVIYAHDFGLAVPANATITGVAVSFEGGSQSVTTSFVDHLQLYYSGGAVGNNKFSGQVIPQGQTRFGTSTWFGPFGGQYDDWSYALTPAIVNDPTFGFGVELNYAENGSGQRLFLYNFKIQVFYTLPVSILNLAGQFQEDDYIHFSVKMDAPDNLTELKLLLDISDGSYQSNFYYYTVDPSQLILATGNTLTQLGLSQLLGQTDVISEEAQAQGLTPAGVTSAGAEQWSEIWFPIRALTRIGDDQTKSLVNLVGVQLLVNASGPIDVSLSSLVFVGGGQPDVGDASQPIRYRIRPRSSTTGARGNASPEMRYGCSPRRQAVSVTLPVANADPQVDTLDVFQQGGALDKYRYVGSVPLGTAIYLADTFDSGLVDSEVLEGDDYEPWPTIDFPLNATASSVVGTTAIVSTTQSNVTRYLPGNQVTLGTQQVYTLWTRPLSLGSNNYLFQFVENAGDASNLALSILEPSMARQMLPYVWGPDAAGTMFACGDPLRPGTVYFTKQYTPDSAPESYTLELCPASEPLLGGDIIDGKSVVASSKRTWDLYPSFETAQRYSPVEAPVGRALAGPYAHCSDGQMIYFWAKDGICATSTGGAKSLTDDDLYPIFPHEGVQGADVVRAGYTVHAPDYSRAAGFRLSVCFPYLFADYQDSTGTYRTLTCDLRNMSWCVDQYASPVSCHYALEQPAGTLLTSTSAYPRLLVADIAGHVHQPRDNASDNGVAIDCVVATPEWNGGDSRAPKFWRDQFIDLVPGQPVTVTPMSFGLPVLAVTTIPQQMRVLTPISLGTGTILTGVGVSANFLGMLMTWSDTFTGGQTQPTQLFTWQEAFVLLPEMVLSWMTPLGTAFGLNGWLHLGKMIVAYSSTAPVTISFSVYDGTAPQPVTLPPTGGSYQKRVVTLTPNKGLLYDILASSDFPWQPYTKDWEVHVKQWGSDGPYQVVKDIVGVTGAAV